MPIDVPGRPDFERVSSAVLDRLEKATESPLERRVLGQLNRAKLPAPVAQYVVTNRSLSYRLDLAWPSAKVGVEVNGFAFHSSRTTFDADARKMAALAAIGWTIFPVTSRSNLDELAAFIRQRLRATAA